MKKFLLGTTAIVGLGMIAGPAAASEKIKLSLGGYMEQWIGYADGEDDSALRAGSRDYNGVDQQSDAEVYFSGKTTLDNGISVSVRVELEADANGQETTPDESYLDISSDTLGLLRLGSDDVADALHYVAGPRGKFSADFDNWLPADNITKNDNAYDQGAANDRNMITYFTPRVFGLQLGASYVPEPAVNSSVLPNRAVDQHSAYSLSLHYQQTFAGVGVLAQVGMFRQGGVEPATIPDGGQNNYHGGLNLTYAGFTLGGAYGRFMTNTDSRELIATSASDDGHHYDVGLQYATGPYTVGVWYMKSEAQGLILTNNNDKTKVLQFHGDYKLGDGVTLAGAVFNANYDEETGVDANEHSGGWGVVGGILVDF